MKALVKNRSEPGIWLEDVDEPTIEINDVLIRIIRTGICGTDLHIYNWDAWAQKTIPVPMVVRHEFVDTRYKMAVMIQGGLDISPVITHRFHFTDFQQGFDVMKSGESGKVILNWQ